MSRARGYGGYHGRTPFWKILVATLLVAVILASAGVIFLQRTLTYDPDGTPHLPVPGETTGAEAAQNEQSSTGGENLPEPVSEPPAESGETQAVQDTQEVQEEVTQPDTVPGWGELRAYRVKAAPLTMPVYGDVAAILGSDGYNAVAVTLKDETGTLFYNAPSAIPGVTAAAADTADALAALTSSPYHVIGRLACFLDNKTSNSNVGKYGLKNTGTYIFFDGNSLNWTDPGKADARAYLCSLARDAAAMGVDEILLSYVGYPTVGKLDKIAYGSTPIADNLTAFLSEMRQALAPYGALLSVEVPRELLNGQGDASGLTLQLLAPWVDRVYAVSETWEVQPFEAAVQTVREGQLPFIPELTTLPAPAPKRYVKIPY